MIRTRFYGRARRAYTPRWWPPTLMAVAVAVLVVLGLRIDGIVAGLVGGGIGLAVTQLRWMVWRRRHPLITPGQYIEDFRRAAPWN